MSTEPTHHYRVRIINPQGRDYTMDFKTDLTAARKEYDQACKVPRKRSIYLEGVNLKTKHVQVFGKRL